MTVKNIKHCQRCGATSITKPYGWVSDYLCKKCAIESRRARLVEVIDEINYLEMQNRLYECDKRRLSRLYILQKMLAENIDELEGIQYAALG